MLAAIIAIFAVVADQLTKYLVVQNIEFRHSAEFIPGFMKFYHTRNTGIAFSMLNEENQRWIFMLFSFISMGLIIYLLIKESRRHVLMTVALAMVLGGGIGNIIDRVRLGYVVDFFCTEFLDFAVFNVADCFITVGAGLLLVYVIFIEPKVEKRLQTELSEKKADTQAVCECAEAKAERNTEDNAENG